jgi:hypothetical protein
VVTRTRDEHVRHCLRMDEAKAWGDQRPTLVYFHWPHDDTPAGKMTEKMCGQILDDEQAARWGLLFRCVQVDMSRSDEGLAETLGAGNRPSIVILNEKAEVVKHIKAPRNSRALAKELESALKKMPETWGAIESKIDAQKEKMKQAEALLRKEEWKAALRLIDEVRRSDLRVDDVFDQAVTKGKLVEARIEQEMYD